MGNARKLKKLERTMNKSRNYDEWKAAAIEHDELSGKRRWRDVFLYRFYEANRWFDRFAFVCLWIINWGE